jgi:hypothetical protein
MEMKNIIGMIAQFTSGVFSFRNGKQKAGFWNYHAV